MIATIPRQYVRYHTHQTTIPRELTKLQVYQITSALRHKRCTSAEPEKKTRNSACASSNKSRGISVGLAHAPGVFIGAVRVQVSLCGCAVGDEFSGCITDHAYVRTSSQRVLDSSRMTALDTDSFGVSFKDTAIARLSIRDSRKVVAWSQAIQVEFRSQKLVRTRLRSLLLPPCVQCFIEFDHFFARSFRPKAQLPPIHLSATLLSPHSCTEVPSVRV